MRGKAGLFSRFVVPASIAFDGSDGATINVGSASRSATVLYTGSGHTTSRVFNMAGTSGGATLDASGSGALVLTAQMTATGSGAKTLTLSGSSTAGNSFAGIAPLANPISFVKSGAGKWRLTGSSTYSGSTSILDGTIAVGANTLPSSGAFGAQSSAVILGDDSAGASGTAALLVAAGVTLTKWIQIPAGGAGSSQAVVIGGESTSGTATVGSSSSFILVGRNVTLQAATGGTVVFDAVWNNYTGDGYPDVDIAVGSSGSTGTVRLTRDVSTTGTVTVNYGTLQIDGSSGDIPTAAAVVINGAGAVLKHTGSIALASPVTLTSGTISGSGEIASAVTAGANATLSPGDPVGSQAFSAGLTLASGGAYRWQINNWTGSAGSGFAQLVVSGDDLSITATSGSTFTIKLVGLTSGNVSGAVPNFDNTTSKSFTIATAGTLAGFASNKFTIDASEFTNNNDLDGGTWSLSDSGDDIVLTFTP
jgi:autotransporter-associated beta strand protein